MSKCTAPCIPACDDEAIYKLSSKDGTKLLGVNCEKHVPKATAKDYTIEVITV